MQSLQNAQNYKKLITILHKISKKQKNNSKIPIIRNIKNIINKICLVQGIWVIHLLSNRKIIRLIILITNFIIQIRIRRIIHFRIPIQMNKTVQRRI